MQNIDPSAHIAEDPGRSQPYSAVAKDAAKTQVVARPIIPLPGLEEPTPAKEEKNDPLTFKVDGCFYRLSKGKEGQDEPYQVRFAFHKRDY